jgi:hypothetical protein
MSREDVEAVKRAWDAWERGDMDALFRFYTPTWSGTRHTTPG